MHTLLFGPLNENTSIPGLDYALTLLSLEQPTNLVLCCQPATCAQIDTTSTVNEKLALLGQFETLHSYLLLPNNASGSATNDFPDDATGNPGIESCNALNTTAINLSAINLSAINLSVINPARINQEEFRALVLKSQSTYSF
ncbi:hypothetical protein TDB9533_01190 [Thalassocella blandensis]|nr:hypothetical protein TDB9533_01190 [Thalassocella blandensis]